MGIPINRRQFLGRTIAGGAAAAGLGLAASTGAAQSANNTINVGVVGLSRGARLAQSFAGLDNCVVSHVCDVDVNRADQCANALDEFTGLRPATLRDLREVFENPDVDAVALAMPVHWHAPAAIMALQAGKHVYVEKPCCHNPREGELLVEAARHYGKAVQMGNQRRSWPGVVEGVERVRAGEIGDVRYSRAWYANSRGSIGNGEETDAPDHIDYDLWQGPAPRRPYKDNLIHYNWHWHWHWGTAESGNNGVHAIDLSRWGLDVDYPTRVSAAGGRYYFDDDQETPDTHIISMDFADGKTIVWEGLSCNVPGIEGIGFGAAFYGDNGSMIVESSGYVLRDDQGREVERQDGPSDDPAHCEDFLTAIRNDTPLELNSEIEEGYKSSLLPLLGNIAYRVGRGLTLGENGRIEDDAEAEALWGREYEPGWEVSV